MKLTRRLFGKGLVLASVTSLTLVPTIGCSTDWIATAEKDIPTITQIIATVGSIALVASGNGALAPEVYSGIHVAQEAASVALATLSQLVADLKASKDTTIIAKIDTVLSDIQTNLSAILAAGQIKDQDLLNTITGSVAIALSVLAAIQTLVPAPATASTRRLAASQKLVAPVTLPTSEQIKSMFNSLVVLNGYSQYQVR